MILRDHSQITSSVEGEGGVSLKMTKVDMGGGGGLSEVDVIQFFCDSIMKLRFFFYLLVKKINIKRKRNDSAESIAFFQQ